MKTYIPFADRRQAGRLLGEKVAAEFQLGAGALVLGLVRGGAVIAHHLAAAAKLPWDILLVRKLGAPQQPEFAIGAFAEPNHLQINKDVMRELALDDAWLEQTRSRAEEDCARLHSELRGDRAAPELRGRELILCDDGMATGLTMQAAVAAARGSYARRVIVAVPVLPPEAVDTLRRLAVEQCYLACPAGFRAVGQFYHDFAPVPSREVQQLLSARP